MARKRVSGKRQKQKSAATVIDDFARHEEGITSKDTTRKWFAVSLFRFLRGLFADLATIVLVSIPSSPDILTLTQRSGVFILMVIGYLVFDYTSRGRSK